MENPCEGGGYLVAAAGVIPADASEFHARVYPWVFGCNRLFCPHCGQWVRNAPGVALDSGDAAALYALSDLSAAPDVHRHAQPRLYLCRCVWRNELDATLLDSERENEPDASRWICRGHPAPSAPLEVDGVKLVGDFGALARRALAGGLTPKTVPGVAYSRPWQWPMRAYLRLLHSDGGGGPAAEFARAVAQAIGAADPGVQAGALRFFTAFPAAPGAEELVAIAAGPRDGLARVANPYPEFNDKGETLEDRLILFVHFRAEQGDGKALAVLRQEAQGAKRGAERALFALAGLDPEWLFRHGVEIVRAHPALAAGLLTAVKLKQSTRLPAVVSQVAGVPGVDAQVLARYGTPTSTARDRKPAPAAREPTHATPAGPLRIDANNSFDRDTDLAALVRENLLGGGTLPSTRQDAAPLDSVERAYRATAGTAYERPFARAVLACATDADPSVRGQALLFFETFRDADGAEELTRLASERRELFAGVDNPWMPSRDLEWQLLRSLSAARFGKGDQAALALGKRAALDGRGEPLIAALAQTEPDWVAAHSAEIVDRSPSVAVAMLLNLPRRLRADVAAGVARSADRHPGFRDDLERFINDDEVKRRVKAALK